MRLKRVAMMLVTSLGMTTAVGPVQAATINLIDWGGVKGSQAERGFRIAADYWQSVLTNDAVINFGISFTDLGGNVVGAADAYKNDYSLQKWEDRVAESRSGSKLDQSAVLPALNGGGNASFIANGVTANGNDDTTTLRYIDGTTRSSGTLYLNNAVAKAIGNPAEFTADSLDGSLAFSNTFKFDFDPRDGVASDSLDFLTVAIHEMGHALGFFSGIEYIDYYGAPNGPRRGELNGSNNDYSTYNALDMFRYSNDPRDVVPGDAPVLDLSVGTASYFSIDGGRTALFDNQFATGAFNGDGDSPSHWKHNGPCNDLGIMDPIVCYGQAGTVSALDLAAMDAIGWNIAFDVLDNPKYRRTMADIYSDAVSRGAVTDQLLAAVPEPASWFMLVLGFGLTGATLRRRADKVMFAVV
jgi:hypothetical protein